MEIYWCKGARRVCDREHSDLRSPQLSVSHMRSSAGCNATVVRKHSRYGCMHAHSICSTARCTVLLHATAVFRNVCVRDWLWETFDQSLGRFRRSTSKQRKLSHSTTNTCSTAHHSLHVLQHKLHGCTDATQLTAHSGSIKTSAAAL